MRSIVTVEWNKRQGTTINLLSLLLEELEEEIEKFIEPVTLVITHNFLFRQFLQLWNPLACSYVDEAIAPVMGERF